jgi:hypothetical protein
VKYGSEEDGYVDYVKGANIAGFRKSCRCNACTRNSINQPLILLKTFFQEIEKRFFLFFVY